MDVSQYAIKGAKSISFPYLSERFVVQKRTSGQPGTKQKHVYAEDKLDLNQNAYISWIIENFDNLQSSIDVEMKAIEDAATSHGEDFDAFLLKLLVDNASATNNVSFSSALTKENLTAMIQKLDEANVPESERSLIIRPRGKKQVMDIADFLNADKLGSDRIVSKGQIGEVFGVPVIMSNNWPSASTTEAVMAHREGALYGFQSAPALGDAPDLDYGVGSRQFAMDQLYGGKSMQSGIFISACKP
jgi:hypothetical protein